MGFFLLVHGLGMGAGDDTSVDVRGRVRIDDYALTNLRTNTLSVNTLRINDKAVTTIRLSTKVN